MAEAYVDAKWLWHFCGELTALGWIAGASEQSPSALNAAIDEFERLEDNFEPNLIRTHAEQSDEVHFIERMNAFLEALGILEMQGGRTGMRP
jgi:hypothetical protein